VKPDIRVYVLYLLMSPLITGEREAEKLVLAFGLFCCSKISANSLTVALNYALAWSGPPLWSSGQSSWLQIQRSRV
jgi:hypothetical protein